MFEIKHYVPQIRTYRLFYSFENNLFKNVVDNVKYDIVVDEKDDIKIGKGHFKLNLKNRKLYFTGNIIFNQGKIIYISNESGHYETPEKILYEFVVLFRELNLFDKSFEIKIIKYVD